MLLSVLLPVRNVEPRHLALSINSLACQTFQDFELLILNHGISVENFDVIDNYSHLFNQLRVIDVLCANTLSETLNIGFSFSCGKYIARMDSDDICLPHRFDTQINFLDDNPSVQIVGSSVLLIDNYSTVTGRKELPVTPYDIYIFSFLNNPFVHPSVMVRRQLFQKYSYSEGIRFSQDFELWSRCLTPFNSYNISSPLIYYRNHLSNISHSNTNEQFKFHIDSVITAFSRISIYKVTSAEISNLIFYFSDTRFHLTSSSPYQFIKSFILLITLYYRLMKLGLPLFALLISFISKLKYSIVFSIPRILFD